MTQQQTAVAEQTVQTGSTPPAAPTGPKKKKRRSKGKLIAGLIVLAAVIVAVAVVLWYFVFRENNEKGAALTDVVQIGSIQATVEGSGMTTVSRLEVRFSWGTSAPCAERLRNLLM